ncbi:Maltose phosphorylase / Trehalose phosphorylase [Pseudonocardia sp. Ae406_Ps2]|uniref:glycoside hydrolase family 65 protein n=1 Tax=unclassified Pseudonocardia TaxID=2619320 RepID=UPI00094AF0D8|nr:MULTISPECIES: glycosyl hydrolase family 65 protein [unclassified Pseudonocardia]OLM00960.1 Maltose phosphorylase / Trehalose phosphorylase [Pseudonocardia sp. Ae406_Ps2]OLM07245.1 Maltose phosphorylase / Trehalose phosphorylase [Pseudonocardia sp. Ae331_Ps2]OLM14439.1 Maltose phosphorylase / Trehalose phosphorylase [Pseudonocardia sp. Ae505_Ps2]OLM22538.1 Maltose phosphorylase / Trehalose phosphorylase [Pseudonocardia sp. Ae706_Ps2]OLM31603.1 Maltose phosphorylase / Trehalose phosphorylase 
MKPDHLPTFTVEPWVVREPRLDLDAMGQTESVFALSNGHIGLRGNLDEGEPHVLPGTYLNSFYEVRPLPYAEGGYGYPESGQTIINTTNGKLIRLLVDDEPFDLRYGTLHRHERVLDMQAGTLNREVEWESPAGRRVRVRSTRMVSLTQRAVAAISYEVELVSNGNEGSGAAGDAALLVLQSELVANEQLPGRDADDPRLDTALDNVLEPEQSRAGDAGATLVHRTRKSGLRCGAAMEHEVFGPDGVQVSTDANEDLARTTVIARVQPGQSLRVVKYLAYGWSSRRSLPAVYDQVRAAIAAARYTGWDGLVAEQRDYLDDFWATADVEIDGDAELQQAVRLATFHILQAGARAERRCIPAKGLTADGYDGHTFWDTETFCLQVLSFVAPEAAADALRWRKSILPLAFERAETLGLKGAAFPWRTIRGHECSGYWPAGTAAFHINADIADAVKRHVHATGDTAFELEVGLELLVATARLWRSLGSHDSAGNFRIDGVTGPDEYSSIADNNVYTNLMAQQNLRYAAEVAAKHPRSASRLGVDSEEIASWRDAASAMFIPFDSRLGVHPQSEGFTDHQRWNFEETPADRYPLLLNYPYFDLYRKQVIKQADLVLAMQIFPEAFTEEQKRRNFAYYEAITVRDSSLSACTQSVMAARTGHLELAHQYLAEAALVDLQDLAGNTDHGMHIASMAGTWTAVVLGFGGMRCEADGLSFAPVLPTSLSRISFGLKWQGRRIRVSITPEETEYRLTDGAPMRLRHHGDPIALDGEAPATAPTPTPEWVEPVEQPYGRAPRVRG